MIDVEEAAEYFVNGEFESEVSNFVSIAFNRMLVYKEIQNRFGEEYTKLFMQKYPV